jgi:predicted nucleic acid-binding protein
MVVVDSSALIPLARIGRLDLLSAVFDEIRTPDGVREEVTAEGQRGTAPLRSFLEDVTVCETPAQAEEVAAMEGIAVTDAAVVLLADEGEEVLLANDKGLIQVARSHGVECWWVTTLLLKCAKEGVLSPTEASDVLYDLVNEGMNLHPTVYTQVQNKLQEIGE